MNRISAVIPCPVIKYNKNIKKFDYQMLMNKEADFTIRRSPILDAYDYWLKHWIVLANLEDNHADQDDLWVFKQIREKLLEFGDKDYVINSLITYVYTVKKSSNKKMLWACFGQEMVENLKVNTVVLDNICPICGKRFKSNASNQECCSENCSAQLNVQKQRIRDALS